MKIAMTDAQAALKINRVVKGSKLYLLGIRGRATVSLCADDNAHWVKQMGENTLMEVDSGMLERNHVDVIPTMGPCVFVLLALFGIEGCERPMLARSRGRPPASVEGRSYEGRTLERKRGR
jgi:hypothetical protein